jgi:alpha-tubulin suppressor-like RCC1 family protein
VGPGNNHVCAALVGGDVKCWGDGSSGQCGYGAREVRGYLPEHMGDNLPVVPLGGGRRATAISSGLYFTCARFDDGAVKCWGENGNGQLGLGDTRNRGALPGEMGEALPIVDVGP